MEPERVRRFRLIDAIEAFSSDRSETIDEILRWPWKKFERFYEAYLRRTTIAQLEMRRALHISALWANSNYDSQEEGKEGPRGALIKDVDQAYDDVIHAIHNGTDIESEREEFRRKLKEDPFFAGMKLPKTEDQDPAVIARLEGIPDWAEYDQS